jgi:hypothetical protein
MSSEKTKTQTQISNDRATLRKEELEILMKHSNFAECLKEEITAVYLINNLMLISTKN